MASTKNTIPDFMRADKQKQADKTREAPIPIREQAKNWLSTDTPILNYTKGFRDAGLLGAPGADETSGSRDTSSGHSAGGFGAAVQGGDISGEFSTGASNAAKNFALGAEYTGSGILGGLEGISDLIGTATWKGVQGITSLGGLAPNKVSEYAGQAADAFLENSITRAWEDSLEERYRPTEGQRKIGQAEQTIARMLPSVAASVVTGSPQVGLAGMGMGAGGSSATEAKREGAGAGRALGYGIASGMLETAIESIAGGIPGLGRGVLSTAFERIMTSPIGGRLIQALGEGGEEALSALLTPYLKRVFYGKDAKNATGEEIAQSALMGIIASGVLQGGLALPSCGKGNDTKGLAISGNDDYDLNSDLEPGLFPEDDYEDLNGDLSFAEDKPEDYEDLNSDLRALAKGAGEAGKRANTAAEGAGDSWYKAYGSLNLPPNYGAVKGTEKIIDLQPGSKLGRFGTYGKSSNFVTALGSAAETLSLPPYTDTSIYQEFTVLKPIPGVTQSTVAPWGGSVGGGMQYRLPMTIEDLLLNGYICK